MLFLHHNESELSRALLAALPSGATVLDCTNGLPGGYTGPMPSAFPSVIVDVPAYAQDVPAYDANGGFTGMTTQNVAAHQVALRLPVSWEAVGQYVAYVAARAAQSPAE